MLAMVALSCSDANTPATPTQPELTSLSDEVKGGSNVGGKGSPHFDNLATFCDFDGEDGSMTCTYQVAGLGKYGSALLVLSGTEEHEWYCGTSSRERRWYDFYASVEIFADRSGNAKGVIEATPVLDWNAICILSGPVHDEHWEPGPWSLVGEAITASGPLKFIYYEPPV